MILKMKNKSVTGKLGNYTIIAHVITYVKKITNIKINISIRNLYIRCTGRYDNISFIIKTPYEI